MEILGMAEPRLTREQERAQKAFEKVNSVGENKEEKWKKDYGRLCLRLPALILQCGLCQALTFYQAKGGRTDVKKQEENCWYVYLKDLGETIDKVEYKKWEDYIDDVRNAKLKRYQWLTRETLACAKWFKRYAEAILKVELTDVGGNED
jgi:CRISPR-associated protein Cmr5